MPAFAGMTVRESLLFPKTGCHPWITSEGKLFEIMLYPAAAFCVRGPGPMVAASTACSP